MRKHTLIAALCALWIIGSIASPTISHAATITVFHGTKTETFDAAKRPAGGVHIARPAIAPPSKPSPAADRAPRSRLANTIFAAGDTLWMRNARTGRLVACAFGSSGKVGKYVIRCTNRDRYGR